MPKPMASFTRKLIDVMHAPKPLLSAISLFFFSGAVTEAYLARHGAGRWKVKSCKMVGLSGSNSVVECDLANSPISNPFNNLTRLRGTANSLIVRGRRVFE